MADGNSKFVHLYPRYGTQMQVLDFSNLDSNKITLKDIALKSIECNSGEVIGEEEYEKLVNAEIRLDGCSRDEAMRRVDCNYSLVDLSEYYDEWKVSYLRTEGMQVFGLELEK